MKYFAEKKAKNNFGELVDSAQREPVAIERKGRAVAVVISAKEYEKIKLECLQARLAAGQAQADRGEFSNKTVTEIIAVAKLNRIEKEKI